MKNRKSIFFVSFVAVLIATSLVIYGCQNFSFGLLETRLGPAPIKQDGRISDALLCGEEQMLPNIEEISFVRFPKHRFSHHSYNNWLYDYIGFPKTILTDAEVQELVSALKQIKPIGINQA